MVSHGCEERRTRLHIARYCRVGNAPSPQRRMIGTEWRHVAHAAASRCKRVGKIALSAIMIAVPGNFAHPPPNGCFVGETHRLTSLLRLSRWVTAPAPP
jgi:hypothetical protein